MSPRALRAGRLNEAFLAKVDEYELDLIVLAGFLVTIPAAMRSRNTGTGSSTCTRP